MVDNVTDTDGKEFFTISSVDGNEFFLVVDRQRNSENVYFLNAVTEEDLMSLAKQNGRGIAGGGNGTSAIPTPTPPITDKNNQSSGNESITSAPDQNTDEHQSAASKIVSNLLMMGGIVIVVGGIAYYLKVIKPRKDSNYGSYDDEDPYASDEAMDEEIDEYAKEEGSADVR